jgi:hypothetical protein
LCVPRLPFFPFFPTHAISPLQIGGCDWGGYVNDAGQNNPTYEFYPSKGGPVGLNILTETLPANLFPLTWLLPSGNIFIQANWGTEIFDYKNNVEVRTLLSSRREEAN